MPITPERVAKLRQFGLSEYASRTYLALLDLGTAEARDISGISKVPASKVYRILEQLHEKGLVAILPEFPRKYAPVPFAEYLDKIHQEHQEAASAIESERETLADMFAVMGDVEGSDRGTFTVVRGRRNVAEKLREIAGSAARGFGMVVTPGLAARPAILEEVAADASRRGVPLRLLVPAASGASFVPPAGAEVRALPQGDALESGSLAVGDRASALLVHFLPDDGHPFEGNDTAVATDHAGVAAILSALFESAWDRGRPQDSRAVVPTTRDIPVAREAP